MVINFRRSIFTAAVWWPEVARLGKKCPIFCFSNHPLWKNFQNSFPKVFIASPIDVLCSNFVKFGRQEIGKVVRYLPDKKNQQNFATLSSSHFCVDRAQNLPGPSPDNVLRVLQISSKSVHCHRSYM